jgi:hypothetical protein
MATRVQIDGIGTIELDDSFKSKSPAEQQSIINDIASQSAKSAAPTPQGGAPMALTISPPANTPSQPAPPEKDDTSFFGGIGKELKAIPQGAFYDPIQSGILLGARGVDAVTGAAGLKTNAYPTLKKEFEQDNSIANPDLAAGDKYSRLGRGMGQLAAAVPVAAAASPVAGEGLLAAGANGLAQGAATSALTANNSDSPFLHVAGGSLIGGAFNPALNIAGRAAARVLAPALPAADQALSYVRSLMSSSKTAPTADALRTFANTAGGKPFPSAEAIGKPAVTGLGALARREGATPDALEGLIDERAGGAPDRVLADYAQATGIDPAAARGDIQAAVDNGRKAAKPFYTDALAGGSIAPLKDQLAAQLQAATGAKGSITRQIKAMEEQYPAAIAGSGAVGADIRARYMGLHDQLKQAEAARQSVLGMFQKAKSDLETNAPGAVWSPRLQQFLDDPIMQRGINRGLELERLDAVTDGRPFNPTEYGVTGTDEQGNAIVGNVPNMRILDAGKKGLDAILREQYTNPLTQRVNLQDPRAAAIDRFRRAYLGELDNLNPSYKAARGKAGDYLSVQAAFDNGGKMILNGNLPASDFAKHFSNLGEAEQQAFKGGIANRLFAMAQNGQLNLKAFNRPILQQKLATALGPQNAAKLLANVKSEISLAKSGSLMRPGNGSSTMPWTAAKEAQDSGDFSLPELPAGAVSMGVGAVTHNPAQMLNGAAQLARGGLAYLRTPGMSVPVRDAAGEQLMLPPAQLADLLDSTKQTGLIGGSAPNLRARLALALRRNVNHLGPAATALSVPLLTGP